MSKATKMCFSCKNSFLKEELIDYAGIGAKTFHSYCKKCYEDKLARERFSNKVCMIFGIKAPGPRIWTERKRLIDSYGYTDDIIIDCLDYIYNIEQKKKLSESLCLVNPITVEKMLQWKKRKNIEAYKIMNAINKEAKEIIVPI